MPPTLTPTRAPVVVRATTAPTHIPTTPTRRVTATALATATSSAKTAAPSTATAAPDNTFAQVTQLLYARLNQERRARNLKSLQPNETLEQVARARSQDMLTRNYFSHNDPVTGASALTPLLEQANYPAGAWGENILERVGDLSIPPDTLAQQFADRWLASPGHAANILDSKYTRTGIGIAVTKNGTHIVVTQLFSN